MDHRETTETEIRKIAEHLPSSCGSGHLGLNREHQLRQRSQGNLGGGPGDLLRAVCAACIHSMARGRSSGCWYRWWNKPGMSKSAPPNWRNEEGSGGPPGRPAAGICAYKRSEEHTSELQSRLHLVCRLLLEK